MYLPASPLQDIEQSSIAKITCRISPTSLLPLTKVVLSAQTSKGYEFASSNPTLFREWLFSRKPILRHGFPYRFSPPHHNSNVGDVIHEYSVIFSEPVAQGYALPSITEILVSLYNNTRPGQRISEKSEADEDEHIEIDQNFMANSVIPKICWVLYSTFFIPIYTFVLLDPNPVSRQRKFTLVYNARGRFSPSNNYTVLLNPSDLNKVGLISGDWVIVTTKERGPWTYFF